MVLCAKIGNCTCALHEVAKKAGLYKSFTCVHGDRGCGNSIPGGMRKHHPWGRCGNPGIPLVHAHGQKGLKGLPRATHCTDRAQTSGNVTPTVELCPPHLTFLINVRARRDVPEKKKCLVYVYKFKARQVKSVRNNLVRLCGGMRSMSTL